MALATPCKHSALRPEGQLKLEEKSSLNDTAMLEKACAVFHPISKKYDLAYANLYSERTHFAEGTTPLLGGRRARAQTQHNHISKTFSVYTNRAWALSQKVNRPEGDSR